MTSDAFELRFGSFDMSPTAVQDLDFEVHVLGVKRGRPVPVTTVMDSMLQDGAVEFVTGHGNRDQELLIGFRGADSQVLAQAEEMLFLECQKVRNELAWTPPDGYGATSVFDVMTTDLGFSDAADWDLDELRGFRVYQLSIRALSFARAETETTVPALASGVTPASTTIADGSSATNWTGTSTVTSSGGMLRQTVSTTTGETIPGGTIYYSAADFTYAPAAPITAFATKNYLSLDVFAPSDGYTSGGDVFVYADGVKLDLVAAIGSRRVYQCTDASVATIKVSFTWQNALATGSMSTALFQIDNLVASNQAPSTAATPGREALRTIEVKGSARSPVSLAIEHATDGLGSVLVYSSGALGVGGYAPNLRVHKVSGSSDTGTPGNISGYSSTVSNVSPEVFRVPTSYLPRCGYLLLGRGYLTGTFNDVEVTVSTRLSTGALIGTTVIRNQDVQTVSGFAVLADLTLPPADVPPGSNATVEIAVRDTGGAGVPYDEMFLCAMTDDAALTIVDCGTGSAALGTANSRLWIDSATLDHPAPAVWAGTAAGRTDAYHVGESAGSWMAHQFVPPLATVFVANSGGANPAISATYYRRGHTHIVEDDD